MNDKLSISYLTAKKIILELLENSDFSTDEEIMKALEVATKKDSNDKSYIIGEHSHIIIDNRGRIYLPDYSPVEVKIPYLPKTVFIFFLIHQEGVEFKSMYNYIQELYDIYQIVALDKNTEASKIRRSLENLVEPVNNRIYETCSIIRRNLSMVVPPSMMEHYCVSGRRGEKHRIRIERNLIEIKNDKLREMFDLKQNLFKQQNKQEN